MFRIREVVGWLLVVFGLYLVGLALSYVSDRQLVEGAVVVSASFLVFRGGIHLVKVSTAAHICLTASRRDSVRRAER